MSKIKVTGFQSRKEHEIEIPFYCVNGSHYYCVFDESQDAIQIHDGFSDTFSITVGCPNSVALDGGFKEITYEQFHDQLANCQTKLLAINQIAKDLLKNDNEPRNRPLYKLCLR